MRRSLEVFDSSGLLALLNGDSKDTRIHDSTIGGFNDWLMKDSPIRDSQIRD